MAGPRPGQTCTVCNHPGIVLINKAILAGQSDYKIAGAFGLNRGVVRNHRAKVHPGLEKLDPSRDQVQVGGRPAVGSGDAQEPLGSEAAPRDRLESLIQRLESEVNGLDYLKPELARELRLAYVDLGKLSDNEPPSVIQVKDVAGLPELFAEMHEALKPWPEAREAMAAVLRRHRAL
jgi:hypothetical protein